jgi:hypothetical protein
MSQPNKPSTPFEYHGDPERLKHEKGVEPRAEAILVRTGQARILVNEEGTPFTDAKGNHLMVDKAGEYMITGTHIMKLNGHETVVMEIPSRLLPSEKNMKLAQEVASHFNTRYARGRD